MTVNFKTTIVVSLLGCILISSAVWVYMKFASPMVKRVETEVALGNIEEELVVTPTPTPSVVLRKPVEKKTENIKKSYNEALAEYANNGIRIQISRCAGIPGQVNIKQGTKFMVDNRDANAHEIKVASVSRKIEAYDYEIFTAPKSGKYNMTCDGKGSVEMQVYP